MNSFLLLCDVFSFIFWKKLKTPKKNLSKLPDLYLRQNSKVKTLTRPETKKETNWHIGKILIQHKFFDSDGNHLFFRSGAISLVAAAHHGPERKIL